MDVLTVCGIFCLLFPGTTLNLLKFPIINPTPYRIFRREARLMADAKKTEEELSEDEQKKLSKLKKQGYLIGVCYLCILFLLLVTVLI